MSLNLSIALTQGIEEYYDHLQSELCARDQYAQVLSTFSHSSYKDASRQ